jgi:hypothetical protein
MQKEQSLVTNTGSTLYAMRYQKTMGYACPDTAPCDTQYYGFQNQVYSAARRFQQYAASPASFGYRAGRTHNLLFNPNRVCGSSPVFVQNQATANLYIYTPYQPNAAALAAGYGSGDGCSAYGNRNFWLYYTDWFGSTQLPGQSSWQPVGTFDAVIARTGATVDVKGWTVDPDTTGPIEVHVFVDGVLRTALSAKTFRPDIGEALPTWGPYHGFDGVVPVSSPGVHEVCVHAINVGSFAPNTFLGCRPVNTTGYAMGNLEKAVVSEGQGRLVGWMLDPDTTAPADLHVYVNGGWGGAATADVSRPDVGASYPGRGAQHGFDVTVPLAPGANQVCIYAINVGPPAPNPEISCTTLELKVQPFGDARFSGGADGASVAGWAIDPETSSPIDVHVYVDGNWGTALTANIERPDVAAAIPGAGPRHGYQAQLPMAPGSHEVCVFAINVKQGTVSPGLGCATVSVGRPPTGNFEAATVKGAVVSLDGWALDPDTTAPIDVHVYADDKFAAVVPAGGSRPDVAAAFPASGPGHGFRGAIVLAPGRHKVCAYAINVVGGTGNPSLGCRDVVVPPSVSPSGTLDYARGVPGHIITGGWTYDPDVPTRPVYVHLYVDGRWGGQVLANEDRPDVGAAIPGAGNEHGYTAYLPVAAGRHTVCAYAIDSAGAANPLLQCLAVVVS